MNKLIIQIHYTIIIRYRINSEILTSKNFHDKGTIMFSYMQIFKLISGSNSLINFSFNSRIKIIYNGKIKY